LKYRPILVQEAVETTSEERKEGKKGRNF